MAAFANTSNPYETKIMPAGERSGAIAGVAPYIFVLLWSTGFIGAKLGLPHSEPFTFLALRVALTLMILVPVAAIFVGKWPGKVPFAHSMVTGVLVHGVYLGGVFFAISRGMPAGVAALVVSLQPLATAFVARAMLGERLSALQMAGLVGGLFGVALVIAPKLAGGIDISGITPVTLATTFASVIGISIGAVYQKRFVSGLDLRLATVAQYTGALIPFTLLSFLTETRQIDWTGEFVFALAWLVLVLSIGAVGLLMLLIRLNTASGTASLFYLVPAVTAVIAFFLFGEKLTPIQLLGMAIVMAAVAVATRAPGKKQGPAQAPGR
jgi:drug/metabolite transporter (DMT)-like permease